MFVCFFFVKNKQTSKRKTNKVPSSPLGSQNPSDSDPTTRMKNQERIIFSLIKTYENLLSYKNLWNTNNDDDDDDDNNIYALHIPFTDGEVLCRLCGKVAESVAHVLAGYSFLVQTKYLYRHNAALKILFFELLREDGLIEKVHHGTHRWCQNQPTRTPRVRRFGIFPSMQSTTKLEQIGSTRDLSATRGKKSAQLKWAAHGLSVELRKMRKRHSSMGPWCGSWSRGTMVTGLNSTT